MQSVDSVDTRAGKEETTTETSQHFFSSALLQLISGSSSSGSGAAGSEREAVDSSCTQRTGHLSVLDGAASERQPAMHSYVPFTWEVTAEWDGLTRALQQQAGSTEQGTGLPGGSSSSGSSSGGGGGVSSQERSGERGEAPHIRLHVGVCGGEREGVSDAERAVLQLAGRGWADAAEAVVREVERQGGGGGHAIADEEGKEQGGGIEGWLDTWEGEERAAVYRSAVHRMRVGIAAVRAADVVVGRRGEGGGEQARVRAAASLVAAVVGQQTLPVDAVAAMDAGKVRLAARRKLTVH